MGKRTIFVAVVAAAAAIFKLQPYQPVLVIGNSMSPTLTNKQWKLASRDVNTIDRGDIVVFNHDGAQYIKRVALIEGDVVTAYYYVDQWCVPTSSIFKRYYEKKNVPTRQIRIPKGEIYVVGDNYNISVDSRTFGPIPVSSVVARLEDSDGPTRTLPGSRFARLQSLQRLADGDWT